MYGDIILNVLVFYPIIGSLVCYLVGKKSKSARDYSVQFIAVTELLVFLYLMMQFMQTGQDLYFRWDGFCVKGLHFVLDGFRVLYGTIAAFMWALTSLLSKQYFGHYRNRNRYYLFFLLTLGATEGVFLSADLYTTFIFFEMMSFTSYVWVAHDENKPSLRAAETYLAVAVIGGLVMLMGLFLLYETLGTLTISELRPAVEALHFVRDHTSTLTMTDGPLLAIINQKTVDLLTVDRNLYAAGACMLFGFGAKAGMFPLHIWLPKAHPVAPAPASALLSGVLTKAGVFGIIIISCQILSGDGVWGSLILLLGICTMVVGAVLAVFSVNLKRTLASSSVSQIGFILTGVGMSCLLQEGENGLAVRGALLHMVNHSLIKLVLFMAAGVVYMNIHKLDLNGIRGFGRNKLLLHAAFLMGALGIGGIPFWNGYVSKTLIHESMVEYTELLHEGSVTAIWFSASGMKILEWAFLISGGMTVAYMTKLYICLFWEKNADAAEQARFDAMKATYLKWQGKIALALSAVVLPVMGFFPQIVMDKMGDLGQGFFGFEEEMHAVHYFSMGNLKGAFISIAIGAVIYADIRYMLMRKAEGSEQKEYVDYWPAWLDLENMIYRPLLLKILPFLFGVACRILDSLVDGIVVLLRKTIYKDSPIPHELEEGTFLTEALGGLADAAAEENRKLHHREAKDRVSYRHKLAMLREEMLENGFVISRSMSFGLMLFCIGLMITVLYLLFR